MVHANAHLTPRGRLRLARAVVVGGWSLARAGERFQCSQATAKKWADRYRAGQPMTDRSSRPYRSPTKLDRRTERRIVAIRFNRRWGARRIAWHLGLNPATVGRVLARYRMPRLSHLDRNTGLPVRKPKPIRYEAAAPGDIVHVDIKKLGRIPDGGGHRMLGRHAGRRNRRAGTGYSFLHHAVDDCTRLAYSEELDDEQKDTAAGFWIRARAHFAEAGLTVKAVMTDNGSCYRSHDFAAALGEGVRHIRTRPYRPQTNGKVERFNRTLAAEWAYASTYLSNAARSATYADWLEEYNHRRPHTALGGHTPT
ncbi:MAG: IS481 family transposase, partial [Dietzia sp.]|nr:IS481 family transposase [Dietzia sp.]